MINIIKGLVVLFVCSFVLLVRVWKNLRIKQPFGSVWNERLCGWLVCVCVCVCVFGVFVEFGWCDYT